MLMKWADGYSTTSTTTEPRGLIVTESTPTSLPEDLLNSMTHYPGVIRLSGVGETTSREFTNKI